MSIPEGARRSTRTKSQPAQVKSTKATPLSKSRKSSENAVDSDENSQEDEVKKGDEDSPVKASQRAVQKGKKAAAKKSVSDVESDVESEDSLSSSSSSSSSSEDDADSGSDFEDASPKQRSKLSAAKDPRHSNPLGKTPVIKAKKPSKASTKAANGSKAAKTSATRRKPTDAEEEEGQEEVTDEDDSVIYAAVLDSQAALDSVVADWIILYESTPVDALRNLTNFLIRSCGCKQLIAAEDFEDLNNMVETLEAILLRYKESTANFDYPIVSKAKEFKKFKKNLLEFYTRLIQKAQTDILFDQAFMESILAWTISLSSSTFRPVRHTSTVVALNIVTSLAEITADVQEELNVTSRQLATSQKQKATQTKIKQLEKKVAQGQHRKEDLIKWIDDIFDSVYVLRCRDVDPLVRADCVRELGQWMIAYPDYFLASSYLRYLTWVLSDKAAIVRQEALKVMAKLYENENQASALRHFTGRVTKRVIEMAIGETDTSARLAAIRVATLVHKHGQLEEDEQVQLSTLIFGANAKVRKSLAKFVKARVWEDEVEGRMAACDVLTSSSQVEESDVKRDRIELKSLVCFLIKVGKTELQQSESCIREGDGTAEAGFRLFDETKVGRVSLAVEALWSEIEALKNWKSIAEYLLEDHSTAPAMSSSQRGQAAATTLDEIYHLDEEEENMLLEIFIASLQLTLNPPAAPGFQKDKAKQKAQLDDLANEVARYCIDVLPQLFLKYGVDADRIRSIVIIPQLIPLNVYLDLRMLSAYEELVDEVIKVFKKHTDPSVLHTVATTLRTMQGYEILRSSHEGKIDALGCSLVDTFLTLIANTPGNNTEGDMMEELTLSLRRLEHLIKSTDVTVKTTRSTDQDPFKVLLQMIKQYRNVQGQDAELPISALSISFLWISWVCRGNTSKYGQETDWSEHDARAVLDMQDALVDIITDLAIKESQGVDGRVRRKAFQVLGDIHWLFGGDMFHLSKGTNRHLLYKTCPETIQAECETFVRTEIELWGEKVQEKIGMLRLARTPKENSPRQNAESKDSEDDAGDGNGETTADPSELLEDEKIAAAQVEQEDKYEMFIPVFAFMRQIILKDFSMGHAPAVIAQYGRFGHEFDEGVKRVVSSIKAQTIEGISRQARDQKAQDFMNVCMESLKESFEVFVDGQVHSTNQALQLAKVLLTVIRPPGFMQSTRVGIDLRLVWNMQRQGVKYAIEKIAGYERIENEIKKAKMVKFFDLLSQLLFGVLPSSDEVTNTQAVIQTESENKGLDMTENSLWDPLRTYQSKLEKLMQKATEAAAKARAQAKAAEDAVQVHEEEQRAQEQEQEQEPRDVEMAPVLGNADHAEGVNVNGEAVESNTLNTLKSSDDIIAQGNGNGKKRRATPEDENENENENDDVGAEEGVEGGEGRRRQSKANSASGPDMDAESESESNFQLPIKQTKRIRME
ncbi:hypothetical protein BGX28_005396 [Mortierella sp. GBA30]|nr:hypothetical protein BGX28_005396 [Mortierella sp. GBA30]